MGEGVLGLLLASALAGTMGWRGDGSGRFAGATPPPSWGDGAGVAWRTPMPGPSNASPVVGGDVVCTLAEPSWILCADQRTGAVRWKAKNDVVDALPEAEAANLRPRLAAADAQRARLKELQATYSQVRREARNGADVHARLAELTTEIATLKAELAAIGPYVGADPDPWMGWTSATPVTDGQRIYALFGTGVVSAYQLDGKRLWSRWLGPDHGSLEAYDGAPGTSPVLAGGALVVGYKDVLGLDPATGRTLWTAGPHGEFGNFAVANVGGTAVVFTPAGLAVRASDGQVLARDLGHTYFAGPVLQGDTLLWAGSKTFTEEGGTWEGIARAYKVSGAGGSASLARLWEVPVHVRDHFYASPLLDGERFLVVGVDGKVASYSARDGRLLVEAKLQPPVSSEIWASPASAGGSWWIPYVDGQLLRIDPATLATQAVIRNEKGLAGPTFHGPWVYLRGASSLVAVRGG